MAKTAGKLLTDKQQTFCEEYLIDLNGTQAAIRAGYSAKTAEVQASRLLSKAKVNEVIQSLKDARSADTGITTQTVVEDLAAIKTNCMELAEGQMRNAASAIRALELLSKHTGGFVDKGELAVTTYNVNIAGEDADCA